MGTHSNKCRLTVLLHHAKEFDNDLGAWSNHALTFSSLLGIVDALERIVQDGCANHDG